MLIMPETCQVKQLKQCSPAPRDVQVALDHLKLRPSTVLQILTIDVRMRT